MNERGSFSCNHSGFFEGGRHMFRNTLSFFVTLLLATTTILAAPGVSYAQRGGRGVGARFGGARFGADRFGAFNRGGFHGEFRRPYFYGGYYPFYGSYGYVGGYSPFYGSYGNYGAYYPDYSSYGYPGSSYDPGYYGYYPPEYYGGASDLFNPYGASANTAVLPAISGNNAVIHVHIPIALADVAFDSVTTTSTGKDRVFTTPELTPGKTYTYAVTANWTEGGIPRTETRTVQVTAGQSSTVDFSKKG
jgi:uncharacterized protein (TIGR03000 family)